MKIFKIILSLIFLFAIVIYIVIYNNQKKQFLGIPLQSSYHFDFFIPFTEVNLAASDLKHINIIQFKRSNSLGVVLFLHGGGGNLNIAEEAAKPALQAGFDFIAFDYPGYGKTTLEVNNKSFFTSSQLVYDYVRKQYPEQNIIVYGRSLGCAMAAQVASVNHPRKVILSSPVYERGGLASQLPPILSAFYKSIFPRSIQYEFATHKYIGDIKCPIVIYCGEQENDCLDSKKLMKLARSKVSLKTITGASHSTIVTNTSYISSFKEALK